MTVEVCTYQSSKATVVTKFSIELLSLSDYLFQKIFFPSKDKREIFIYCIVCMKVWRAAHNCASVSECDVVPGRYCR